MATARTILLTAFLELLFVVLTLVAGAFAFLPLFADHAPFPGWWSNSRVVALTALVALAVVDGALIMLLDRWYRRHSHLAPHRTLVLIINILWSTITALPVLSALVSGGT